MMHGISATLSHRLVTRAGLGIVLGVFAACSDGASENDRSPTGTYWEPSEEPGLPGGGYVPLDEACDNTADPDYLHRFETPMFRSVAYRGGVAYLVDGSLLWAVDVDLEPQSPEDIAGRPRRLSLTRLDGHPLQVDLTPAGHLLVASGEAGLAVLDVQDPRAPRQVTRVPLEGRILDVKSAGELAVVAAGSAGLAVLRVDGAGDATPLAQLRLPGYAVAADLEGSLAYVAGCSTLSVVDLQNPMEPVLRGSYWVPHGHAKEVDATASAAYVAGGEALIAYDTQIPEALLWTGYYADREAEGFYVNAVVVNGDVAYIAAGDESVRSVDLTSLSIAEGVEARIAAPDEPAPELGGPETLADPDVIESPDTVNRLGDDPIGIGLHGDLLMVLGNFRWMGERTLELLRVSDQGEMRPLASYIQPSRSLGISHHGEVVVLHEAGGHQRVVSLADECEATFRLDAPVRRAVSLPGGLYLLTDNSGLYRWEECQARAVRLFVPDLEDSLLGGLTGAEDRLFLTDRSRNSMHALDLSSPQRVASMSSEDAFLGWARIAARLDPPSGRIYVYAYDPQVARLSVLARTDDGDLTQINALHASPCEVYDIRDYYAGDHESRSQVRVVGDRLYLLCPRDSFGEASVYQYDLMEPAAPQRVRRTLLPAGRYVGFDVHGSSLVTLRFDNDRYRSTLTRTADGEHRSARFTGVGRGLVVVGDQALVADGEGGLRVFELSEAAPPNPVAAPWAR